MREGEGGVLLRIRSVSTKLVLFSFLSFAWNTAVGFKQVFYISTDSWRAMGGGSAQQGGKQETREQQSWDRCVGENGLRAGQGSKGFREETITCESGYFYFIRTNTLWWEMIQTSETFCLFPYFSIVIRE